jgi:hypothetical protein
MAKSIKKLVKQVFAGGPEHPGIPEITDIAVSGDGTMLCQLREGKWIRGRFVRNVQVDQPPRLDGQVQPHAYVYGRHGERPVAVSIDGASSHGEKGRLHRVDADALRELGFKIPPDGVVEWTGLTDSVEILLD